MPIPAEARRCWFCQSDLDESLANRWLSSHPTLAVSLATFLYVAFQVYKASDYEVNTTTELVRASGLSAILVGVLLVQLPLELLLLTLAAAWWMSQRGQGAVATSVVLVLVLLTIGFFASPWPIVLAMVVVPVAAALARAYLKGRPLKAFRASLILLMGACILYLGARPTIWVPAERVETDDRGTIVAYVIASDGDWTTLLTPRWTGYLTKGANSVVRERTRNVASRTLCAIDFAEARNFSQSLRLRPAQLLTGNREPENPPCR
ncbi:MAG: hypothetical protein ACJ74O_05810 [Frankiaceae bacterium]